MNLSLAKEFPLKGDHGAYPAGGSFPEVYPRGSLEENSEGYSDEKQQTNNGWISLTFYEDNSLPGKGMGRLPASHLHIKSRSLPETKPPNPSQTSFLLHVIS